MTDSPSPPPGGLTEAQLAGREQAYKAFQAALGDLEVTPERAFNFAWAAALGYAKHEQEDEDSRTITACLDSIAERVAGLNADSEDPIVEILIGTSRYDNGYFYSLGTVRGRTRSGELWWVELDMDDGTEADLGNAICDGRLMDDSALVVEFDWSEPSPGDSRWSYQDEPDWQTLKQFEGAPLGTIEDDDEDA
jgi:hypothetical protein